MKIGVLSLQGDFEAHGRTLARLGVEPVYVRSLPQLAEIRGLIIPGGESTTMLKLLDEENLFEALVEFGRKQPIFGTCAGTILLASDVSSPPQRSMKLIQASVERNAYGRQVASSIRPISLSSECVAKTEPGTFEGVFIRAPIIRSVGPEVRVLGIEGAQPVLIDQGRHMAATFHPELTADDRIHRLFLDKVRSNG